MINVDVEWIINLLIIILNKIGEFGYNAVLEYYKTKIMNSIPNIYDIVSYVILLFIFKKLRSLQKNAEVVAVKTTRGIINRTKKVVKKVVHGAKRLIIIVIKAPLYPVIFVYAKIKAIRIDRQKEREEIQKLLRLKLRPLE